MDLNCFVNDFLKDNIPCKDISNSVSISIDVENYRNSYNIDLIKYEEFLENFLLCIENNCFHSVYENIKMSLSYLRFDIDISEKMNTKLFKNQKSENDFLITVCKSITKELILNINCELELDDSLKNFEFKKIKSIDDILDKKIYILKRPKKKYITRNYVGYHLLIPELIMYNSHQTNLIKTLEKKISDIFDINKPEKLLDNISKNPWTLYKSSKPEDKHSCYMIYKVWCNNNIYDYENSDYVDTDLHFCKYFSVYNIFFYDYKYPYHFLKYEDLDIDEDCVSEIMLYSESNENIQVKDKYTHTIFKFIDLNVIKNIILYEEKFYILSDDRTIWLKLMYILYIIYGNDDGYVIWDKFSSKSTKYNARECKNMWDNLNGPYQFFDKYTNLNILLKIIQTTGTEMLKIFKIPIESLSGIKDNEVIFTLAIRLFKQDIKWNRKDKNNKSCDKSVSGNIIYYMYDESKNVWITYEPHYMLYHLLEHVYNALNFIKKYIINEDLKNKIKSIYSLLINARTIIISRINYLIMGLCEEANFVTNVFPMKNVYFDLTSLKILQYKKEIFVKHKENIIYKDYSKQKDLHDKYYNIFRKIFPQDQVWELFLDLCAYIYKDGNWNKMFFIFYGHGNSGKSFISSILCNIFGSTCKSFQPTILTDKTENTNAQPDIVSLSKGKVGIISELRKQSIINASKIKLFTGNDNYEARLLHQNTTTFKNNSKIILNTNYIPELDPLDDALWNRVVIIPFISTFKNICEDDNENHFYNIDKTLQNQIVEISEFLLYYTIQHYINVFSKNDLTVRVSEDLLNYKHTLRLQNTDILININKIIKKSENDFISVDSLYSYIKALSNKYSCNRQLLIEYVKLLGYEINTKNFILNCTFSM